jgi:CHASE2 domain-containing sensor protein
MKRKKFSKTKIVYCILGIFLAVLLLFFSYSRVFDEFEYSMLDFRYRMRPVQSVSEDIVIIEIGDDSIEKLGKWPFPRKYHALLVKALDAAGARTIIFDIFFSEAKEGDEQFAEAVKDSGNVYIPYVFNLDFSNPDTTRVHADEYVAPLIGMLKRETKGTGFVNVEPDNDGKVRRVPAFIEYERKVYPYLTVLAALNDLGYKFDDVEIIPARKMVASEDLIIPLGERSSLLVDYPAPWGKAFRHYSYVDILQSYLADVTEQKPVMDLGDLRGTVCFIGLTATASSDTHPSPLESLYPGVGVHASVYNSIVKNKFLQRADKWWNLLVLAVMWLLTGYVTAKSRKWFTLLSIIFIMTAYFIVAMLLFWQFGIWIDVFYPVVTIIAIYIIVTFKKYVREIQKREIIEKELDIAKDIQRSFLPAEIPEVGGMDMSVSMLTARQVGGDLYDVVRYDAVGTDNNKLGVMLGDVSGKGVPAALYMARAVSVFRTFAREGSASEVLKNVNERLMAYGGSNFFVTLTYMIFDTKANNVTFAIGGHMPTIMVDPSGGVELLDVEEGLPLGVIEGDFSLGKRNYERGSLFVLYSDGVTEAMNIKEEMFDEERLIELVREMKDAPTKDIVSAINKAVMDFAGKAEQHDDITVMVIRT